MPGTGFPDIAAFAPYIVAMPIVIVAVVLLLRILRANRATAASAGWRSAPGRILESHIVVRERRGGGKIVRSNYPHVVYEYAVGRQRFVGNRIAFGSPVGLGAASWVRRAIARYQPGGACTVFYNPADPADAVLERRGVANRTLWIALAIIGAIVVVTQLPNLFMGGWRR